MSSISKQASAAAAASSSSHSMILHTLDDRRKHKAITTVEDWDAHQPNNVDVPWVLQWQINMDHHPPSVSEKLKQWKEWLQESSGGGSSTIANAAAANANDDDDKWKHAANVASSTGPSNNFTTQNTKNQDTIRRTITSVVCPLPHHSTYWNINKNNSTTGSAMAAAAAACPPVDYSQALLDTILPMLKSDESSSSSSSSFVPFVEPLEYIRMGPRQSWGVHSNYRVHDTWKYPGPRVLTMYVTWNTDTTTTTTTASSTTTSRYNGGAIGFPNLDWTMVAPPPASSSSSSSPLTVIVWPNVKGSKVHQEYDNHVLDHELLPTQLIQSPMRYGVYVSLRQYGYPHQSDGVPSECLS